MPKKELTSIDDVLAKINKDYGNNTIYKIKDCPIQTVETIKTGSEAIDNALGIKGLPRGRIVEMYGEPSCGKSSIALSVITKAQKDNLKCFFIDAEHAFDPNLAKGIGVDIDELFFCQPDHGESALDIVDRLVESGHFALGVVDSVASLVPKAELEGEITEQQMGLQARLLGKHFRKCTGKIAENNICMIYINQTRSKMGGFGYGPQKDTPGGAALKFHASIRLEVKRIGSIKEKDNVVGNKLEVIVTKNKLAPPLHKAHTNLYFGKGFNELFELIEKAIDKGVIESRGAWYYLEDTKIGQGITGVRDALENDKVLLEVIKNGV